MQFPWNQTFPCPRGSFPHLPPCSALFAEKLSLTRTSFTISRAQRFEKGSWAEAFAAVGQWRPRLRCEPRRFVSATYGTTLSLSKGRTKSNVFMAWTTVSPFLLLSSTSWTTPSISNVLKDTFGVASTTHYTNIEKQINTEVKYTPYEDRPETYFVPIVFLLILVIGLTGNGVLALIILRHSNMRNVPNIYVFSLALGDLLARVYSYSRFIIDVLPSLKFSARKNDQSLFFTMRFLPSMCIRIFPFPET